MQDANDTDGQVAVVTEVHARHLAVLIAAQVERLLVGHVYDHVTDEQVVLVVNGPAGAAHVDGALVAEEVRLVAAVVGHRTGVALGSLVSRSRHLSLGQQEAVAGHVHRERSSGQGGAQLTAGGAPHDEAVLSPYDLEKTVVQFETLFAKDVMTVKDARIGEEFQAEKTAEYATILGQFLIGCNAHLS